MRRMKNCTAMVALVLAILFPILLFAAEPLPLKLSITRQGEDMIITGKEGSPFARYSLYWSDAVGTNAWTSLTNATGLANGNGEIFFTNYNAAVLYPKRFYRGKAGLP